MMNMEKIEDRLRGIKIKCGLSNKPLLCVDLFAGIRNIYQQGTFNMQVHVQIIHKLSNFYTLYNLPFTNQAISHATPYSLCHGLSRQNSGVRMRNSVTGYINAQQSIKH